MWAKMERRRAAAPVFIYCTQFQQTASDRGAYIVTKNGLILRKHTFVFARHDRRELQGGDLSHREVLRVLELSRGRLSCQDAFHDCECLAIVVLGKYGLQLLVEGVSLTLWRSFNRFSSFSTEFKESERAKEPNSL